MKYLIPIIGFLALQSCSRQYTYLKNKEPKGDTSSILVTQDFDCYVRDVYRVQGERQKMRTNPFGKDSTGQQVQYYSMEQEKTSNEDLLLEIEYILISKQNKAFIYITTVPDVNMRYYTEVRKKNPPEVLNAYDFNTIQLGKLIGNNMVEFQGLKTGEVVKWEYDAAGDDLELLRIIEYQNKIYRAEYSIVNGIAHGAKFKKIEPIQLVLQTKRIKNGTMPEPRFQFLERKRGTGRLSTFCIYFKFNTPEPNETPISLRL